MKRLLFMMIALIAMSVQAQEEVPDTICLDNFDFKPEVTQHSMEAYDYIDTCTTRYAVVHDWLGRCGIYNLETKKNITELEYRELYYAHTMKLEDGSEATIFGGKKGIKQGIVSVGPSDDVMSVMMDDEDMFYSLDGCKTLDNIIAKKARKFLMDGLTSKENAGALCGQALVMDSKTGQIKAWVALEKNIGGNGFDDARLRRYQCSAMPGKIIIASMAMYDAKLSWNDTVDTKCGIDTIGGLLVKDRNWGKGGFGKITYMDGFKKHSDIAMAHVINVADGVSFQRLWKQCEMYPREIDAMNIAAMYNVVAQDGLIIEPSVNSDSVEVVHSASVDGTNSDVANVGMTRDILKAILRDGGVDSEWTTKKVDISGDYCVQKNCSPTLYDDNAAELEKFYSKEDLSTYNQVIFTGYFPSDNPRYTICVTMETEGSDCSGKNISTIVNKLAEYLNKH